MDRVAVVKVKVGAPLPAGKFKDGFLEELDLD